MCGLMHVNPKSHVCHLIWDELLYVCVGVGHISTQTKEFLSLDLCIECNQLKPLKYKSGIFSIPRGVHSVGVSVLSLDNNDGLSCGSTEVTSASAGLGGS